MRVFLVVALLAAAAVWLYEPPAPVPPPRPAPPAPAPIAIVPPRPKFPTSRVWVRKPRNGPRPRYTHPAPAIDPLELRIVALSDDPGIGPGSPIESDIETPILLHAVMRARSREGGRELVIGDERAARRAGFRQPARRWRAEELRCVTWLKVEPESYCHWNTTIERPDQFTWREVAYRSTAYERGVAAVEADVRPSHSRAPRGFGTMRFQLTYADGPRAVATPGPETMRATGPNDRVFRVSRALDTGLGLLDRASLLGNVPYIFGAHTPDGQESHHQAERFYGSDCADTITFAMRRLGRNIPYGFTGSFEPGGKLTVLVASPKPGPGSYVDGAGKPIVWGAGGARPGDLVLWKRHIAILVGDEPPARLLDENDLVFHHLGAPPGFAMLGYAYRGDFRIVRLRSEAIPAAPPGAPGSPRGRERPARRARR